MILVLLNLWLFKKNLGVFCGLFWFGFVCLWFLLVFLFVLGFVGWLGYFLGFLLFSLAFQLSKVFSSFEIFCDPGDPVFCSRY